MVHVVLVYAGLLAGLAGDAPPSSQDLQTYEALKRKAGDGPQAQVKLALWCEAHGLNTERLEHLSQAILADPKNATARADGPGRLRRSLGVTRSDRRTAQGR